MSVRNTLTTTFFFFVVFLLAFHTQAYAAESAMMAVSNASHADALPQQYIVMLNTTDETEKVALYKTIVKHGGSILHQYDALNGFAAVMPEDALVTVRTSTAVSHIEADMIVRGMTDPVENTINDPANWGLDRIDNRTLPMDNAYTSNSDGTGVHVYVFDTGINAEHSEFDGRVVNDYDNIEDGLTSCGNHGTGVAGIIGGKNVGVASGVTLHAMRVLDCNVAGNVSRILEAMDWLSDNAQYPAIVNMSLGSYDSVSYDAAVDKLISKGITVVAAAGNKYQYDACKISPGGASNVITVAASDQADRAATFTAMGACVELFAPGVDIYMATDETEGYRVKNGTSYATPHVTGCAARYLQQNPFATPAEVKDALLAAATPGLISGDLQDTPNRLLYCQFDTTDTTTLESESVNIRDIQESTDDAIDNLPVMMESSSLLVVEDEVVQVESIQLTDNNLVEDEAVQVEPIQLTDNNLVEDEAVQVEPVETSELENIVNIPLAITLNDTAVSTTSPATLLALFLTALVSLTSIAVRRA